MINLYIFIFCISFLITFLYHIKEKSLTLDEKVFRALVVSFSYLLIIFLFLK